MAEIDPVIPPTEEIKPPTTTRSNVSETTTPPKHKVYQVLYYILGLIEVLLSIRFVLLLFGANIEAGFAQLIKTLTDPLMAPFVGLFPPRTGETSIFSPSTLVAMVVYALVFYGIAQLIRIFLNKKP